MAIPLHFPHFSEYPAMLEGIGLGDGVAVWCGGRGCGGRERVGRAGRVRGDRDVVRIADRLG